jgi:hypothetical protein
MQKSKGISMYVVSKAGCFSQPKFLFIIFMIALCIGCNSDKKEVLEQTDEIVVIDPSLDDSQDYIGSWFSNCGERENSGYFINELTLINDDLEVIQHKYDASDCTGVAIESVSQTNLSYTYPDTNSDTNDKFIVVEVFKDPSFYMTINFEIYDNLLYLSYNFLVTHEGFAFDSSQTNDINYVNYLTK